MTPEIVSRYADRPLPRYTSYPTAPHFAPGMTPERYAHWLAELPPTEPVSVYLHVPFCRSMCWYCGCHTTVTAREEPITRYLESLLGEIAWVRDAMGQTPAVRHIHFGGGTPSLMQPRQFVALMDRLRETFRIDAASEVAIELDPRTLDAAMIDALARGGVTRASLGVQSFDPAVQRAINRIQSFEQTAEAARHLRAAGVTGINFDLIYGLPHQTVDSCAETVAQSLTLLPDRFAVFGYAHVPSFKIHQRKIEEAALPDGAARHAQAEAIAELLQDAGYVRIGLDHYARPDDDLARAFREGRLHRNFQGYTTDACPTLIGFGASSIGRLPQGYVQNSVLIGEYQKRVGAHGTAVAKACGFQGQDKLRATIIERIMCDYRADLGTLCLPYGVDASAVMGSAAGLGEIVHDGLAAVSGNVIEVPEAARPLVRVVAAAFDEYLGKAPARHSRAI
ncbi:MAG: oxygen-independent coproporphyrinogen III oxidase [Sphingomonas sp.]|uniref:oxygen-independent coproporphyrinogen III oxidase n=1 Tax=Sphingomonas sp. TaxID=28214 RepID=UPI0025D079C3|nr:oxygen-independent coproporphyrinogen III oxidase [Sphingomonas sp.]MBX3565421.1 oxygen-independent coproporphyrinogen III oxidase [Sphingomonas sp.]